MAILVICTILALLTSLVKTQSADMFISVNPNTNMLIDVMGRERIFHGTNVVVKGEPFYPHGDDGPDSFTEDDMKLLQSLGLNTVRLGMMMPGYVPQRGEYNETYIETIGTIVKLAAKYGIYTLLDMHQDVFSPKLCVEGMPDWIVNTGDAKPFPYPLSEEPYKINPETGYPYPEDCAKLPWGNYYFAEASGQAFQNLYSNVDLNNPSFPYISDSDTLCQFHQLHQNLFTPWEKGTLYHSKPSRCRDHTSRHIFLFRNPLLLVPGIADKLNLEPAYDVLQKAIRQVDDQHAIFFEGVTWDFFEVGFSKVPGGAEYQNRSVLSYHYYEPPDFSKTLSFAARMNDLKRLKCGGFLTEMLVVDEGFDAMYEMFDLADKYKQSWQGWDYHRPPNAKNNQKWKGTVPNHIVVQNTSRTYPQAVAGNIQIYHFNKDTKEFSLSYRINPDCKSTLTEIYFNKEMHYPNGYQYSVSSNVHFSEQDYRIILSHIPAYFSPGDLIEFSISPK
ncbi:endoglycoceramidase-like [Clytia hemisphaerica]